MSFELVIHELKHVAIEIKVDYKYFTIQIWGIKAIKKSYNHTIRITTLLANGYPTQVNTTPFVAVESMTPSWAYIFTIPD